MSKQASRIEHEKSLLKWRLGVCWMNEGGYLSRLSLSLQRTKAKNESMWNFEWKLKVKSCWIYWEEAQHILKQILYFRIHIFPAVIDFNPLFILFASFKLAFLTFYHTQQTFFHKFSNLNIAIFRHATLTIFRCCSWRPWPRKKQPTNQQLSEIYFNRDSFL